MQSPTRSTTNSTVLDPKGAPDSTSRPARFIAPFVGILYAAIVAIAIPAYLSTRHPGPVLFFALCTAGFYILCYSALSFEVRIKLWLEKNYPALRGSSIGFAVVLAAIPVATFYFMRPLTSPAPTSQFALSQPAVPPAPVNARASQPVSVFKPQRAALLTDIRYWSAGQSTSVVIELDQQVEIETHRLSAPNRIYFDLSDSALDPARLSKTILVQDSLLRAIRVAEREPHRTRVTLETNTLCDYSVTPVPDSHHLLVELYNAHSQQ